MRAVVVRAHGPVESLSVSTVQDPSPGPGEVLVRVKACALNHLDVWVRRGVPGHEFPLPIIPGSDVSGVVESANASGVKEGDAVIVSPFVTCGRCEHCLRGEDVRCRGYAILGESRDGGCAEFLVVPAQFVFPKPENLDFVEAASILLAPLTAYHMVATRARVSAGERVLVSAAAGGVGTSAVQIARTLGAEVVGLVGSSRKAAKVRELGASEVVVVDGRDPYEAIRAALGNVRFDAVVDSVGGRVFEAGMRLLKPFGRLVTCGATSVPSANIDLRRLFFLSLSVLGSTMGSRWELVEVLRMAERGELRPVIHRTFPLDEIAAAHEELEERRVVGKVVVQP